MRCSTLISQDADRFFDATRQIPAGASEKGAISTAASENEQLSKSNVTSHAELRPVPTDASEKFLPFTKPAIEREDIDEVVAVLESGWITSGAKVRELEAAFVDHTGGRHAIAVSSATAGIHLVLHALGVGPGEEVITPSMTWVSTVNLIRLCGAKPIFVDVNKDTLMVEASAIERVISERTKLIIPVHFAGAPLDSDALQALTMRFGIPMVDDSAHALGTEYNGAPVGSVGTHVFSLQAIKNVTTAEGGIVVTDHDELAERLRRLRFHGLGSDAFDRTTNGRLPGADVIEPGYKYNMPDMNACLALGQLRRLSANNARRAQLAERYTAAFSEMPAIAPLSGPNYPHTHSWHLFIVRVDINALNISRDQFMAELKLLGIGTGLHFRAVHEHQYYRESTTAHPALVNTEWNSARIMTLPLFPGMTNSDVDRVVRSVRLIVDRNMK